MRTGLGDARPHAWPHRAIEITTVRFCNHARRPCITWSFVHSCTLFQRSSCVSYFLPPLFRLVSALFSLISSPFSLRRGCGKPPFWLARGRRRYHRWLHTGVGAPVHHISMPARTKRSIFLALVMCSGSSALVAVTDVLSLLPPAVDFAGGART